MGVISWCRNGDRAGTAHVGVAQLVSEDLQLIRGEMVVVPQHMIVGGPTGSLWRFSNYENLNHKHSDIQKGKTAN